MENKHDKRYDCGICTSSIENEIMTAKKSGVPTAKLFKKFVSVTGYKGDKDAFYMILYRHINKGHHATVPQVQEVPKEDITLENYAERLLSKAMGDPEMMEGKKITHQAVIAAQKILNDRNRIRQEESLMKQMFLKLFRGKPIDLPKEVIDELARVQQSDTN